MYAIRSYYALHRGEKIEIRGFGSFTVRVRRAKEGRNPKTGEKVSIPEKRIPFFKVGKELRELVNRITSYNVCYTKLLRGRTSVVTPSAKNSEAALRRIEALWRRTGARVLRMDPETHDHVFAYVSHLPHAVAYALVHSVATLDSRVPLRITSYNVCYTKLLRATAGLSSASPSGSIPATLLRPLAG